MSDRGPDEQLPAAPAESARAIYGRNVFWLGSATVAGMVASLLYGILVARYLGPAAFGSFALVVGVGGMLTAVAQGSGSTALVVLAAHEGDRAGDIMWPGAAVQGGFGIAGLIASLAIVWLLTGDASLLLPTLVYSLANLAALLLAVPVSIFRGLNRMQWGIAFACAGWLTYALTLLVVHYDLGFVATLATSTLALTATLVVVFVWSARTLKVGRWVPGMVGQAWSRSLALLMVTLVQSLHWRTGTLTVQVMAGSYQLGLYSAAAKLVENMRSVPWFLLMALLPAFVRLGQTDRNQLSTLLNRALRWITILAFPLTVVLAALSPLVVGLLYTPEFAASGRVLRICAFGLVPLFIQWVFLNALVAMRMERALSISYLIAIALEVGANWFLVPRWGADGAAMGYVIGEVAAACVSGLYVARALAGVDWRQLWRAGLPGALALTLVAAAPATAGASIAWAAGICALYAVGAILTGAVTRHDWEQLVRLRSARNG